MKYASFLFCIVLASMTVACSQEPSYLVESVEDGDTIVVKLNGESRRIQLSGIDAPEDTENAKLKLDVQKKNLPKEVLLEMGKVATDFLKTQVKAGQKIKLQGDLSQQDKYGRTPAIVFNKSGEPVNERMVEEGYAILLSRFPLEEKFKANLEKAEQQARSNKKGLWQSHAETTAKWSGR